MQKLSLIKAPKGLRDIVGNLSKKAKDAGISKNQDIVDFIRCLNILVQGYPEFTTIITLEAATSGRFKIHFVLGGQATIVETTRAEFASFHEANQFP